MRGKFFVEGHRRRPCGRRTTPPAPFSSRQGRLVSSKEPSRDHWLTRSHARHWIASLSIRRALLRCSPPPFPPPSHLLARRSFALAPFRRGRAIAHTRSPTITTWTTQRRRCRRPSLSSVRPTDRPRSVSRA